MVLPKPLEKRCGARCTDHLNNFKLMKAMQIPHLFKDEKPSWRGRRRGAEQFLCGLDLE